VTEKKVKRVIRIKCAPDIRLSSEPWYYKSTLPCIYFGFCGKDVIIEGKDRYKYQASQMHACREVLATRVYEQVTKTEDRPRKVPIDMDTLRLLIVASKNGVIPTEDVKKRIFLAKRIMNLIEDYAGWEKSTISTVIHTEIDRDNYCSFLFTGPKEYVRYPQVMSLMCLIFRVAFNGMKLEYDSIDAFIDGVFNWPSAMEEIKDVLDHNQVIIDIAYLKEIVKHLKVLLNKFYDVFEGKFEDYYSEDYSKFNGYGGMTSLINGDSGNPPLNKRLHHHVFSVTKKEQ